MYVLMYMCAHILLCVYIHMCVYIYQVKHAIPYTKTLVIFFLVNLQVVVSNLVDSNVFLRAVILSLEFFSARRSELKVGWRQ
jgi:hypothetical protein